MSEELGTLIIVVLKARNLNDKHSFYKQDVFTQVSLNGVQKRTHVDVKGGQHPVWDAELRFPVMKDSGMKHRKLEIECFAKEHKADDTLGAATLDITETLRTGEFDDWVSLSQNNVSRGEVYLEMTYYASAPGPGPIPAKKSNLSVPSAALTRRPSKLSPSDRLSRPPQNSHVPAQSSSHTNAGYTKASHVATSTPGSDVTVRNEQLPPPPHSNEEIRNLVVPNVLVPGSKLRPRQPAPPSLPSILHPGIPSTLTSRKDAEYHDGIFHIASSPPSQYLKPDHASPYNHPTDSTSVQRISGHSANLAPSIPPHTASQIAPLGKRLDDTPSGAPSFPVPFAARAQKVNDRGNTDQDWRYASQGQQVDYRSDRDSYTSLPVRYHTPLPFPSNPPPSDQYQRRESDVSEEDKSRIYVLQIVEEEAAFRKAQEQKDLELALKLDRELNTTDEESQPTARGGGLQANAGDGMPGGW
ncbi:hypothetical protein BDQ12DRAFT_680408 [Crucibulum laeve]|uniref:C2 domain-containing protein n=1 Tax=Crucibulum laeve TaxID=68775 RepID=A0A5C3M3Z6_9AGAR|nr:hypothetical protein BDQ12DRAFT_680408 [Crucibulum laeve]